MCDIDEKRIGDGVVWLLREAEAGRKPAEADIRRAFPEVAGELIDFASTGEWIEREVEPLRDPTPDYLLPCGEDSWFGDYRLESLIQVGGMGAVYLVFKPDLKRFECLKLIKSGELAGRKARDLFHDEVERTALLKHPNIVKVFDCGEHAGRLFFTMEYQSGGDLSANLAEFSNEPRKTALLMAKVAGAVQYAHEEGRLIHRDLKPANVLLDARGEPLVADFGLAGRVRQRSGDPAGDPANTVEGTPAYMAPEQAFGGTIDHRTDVFGLGATLYHLLTGRPPYMGECVGAVLEQAKAGRPPAPRSAEPWLDAICVKCLEADPDDRYQSASELTEDLQRFTEGRRPRAVRAGIWGWLHETIWQQRPDRDMIPPEPLSILAISTIVVITNSLAYLCLTLRMSEPVVWAAVFISYVPFFVILGFKLDPELARNPGACRLMWSLWIGHALACAAVLVSLRLTLNDDHVGVFLTAYPIFAALSGLAFMVMGCFLWGPHYLMGAAWMILAALMPLWRESGPMQYGAMMTICTALSSTQVRRRESSC